MQSIIFTDTHPKHISDSVSF